MTVVLLISMVLVGGTCAWYMDPNDWIQPNSMQELNVTEPVEPVNCMALVQDEMRGICNDYQREEAEEACDTEVCITALKDRTWPYCNEFALYIAKIRCKDN